MEVIAFHFVPPEVMQRKKDGTLESVSNAAARRVFQALSGGEHMPEVESFTLEGRYSLNLTPEKSDKAALVIGKEKAAVVMRKTGSRRSHRLLDIKGNALLRKRVAVLTDSKVENMRGLGIVIPQNNTYALEWYVYNLGYFIEKQNIL